MGVHNHTPDAIKCDVKKVLGKIKKDAQSLSTVAPSQIIAQNVQGMPAASQGSLPLLQNIKRGIRNVRSATMGSLVVPHCREDINLPDAYKVTSTGESFLLFDSGIAPDRIMIFGTDKNLDFLSHSEVWLVDGTFKLAPSLFDQIFIIHGLRNKTTVPLLYCLTPSRTTQTYTRVLTAIKTLKPNLDPKQIMSDFELASINAFRDAFPQAEQKGCFFHYTQSLFRQIQKRPDILRLYSKDPEFALKLRHLDALALIPPADVISTFEQLIDD
jgi:MULE transposase domain